MKNSDEVLIQAFLKRRPEKALAILNDWQPESIGNLLDQIGHNEGALVLSGISHLKAVEVMEKMSSKNAARFIDILHPNTSRAILIKSSDAFKNAVFQSLPRQKSEHLKRITSFKQNQIGAQLNNDVITQLDSLEIGDVLKHISKIQEFKSRYIYLLNTDNKLTGIVDPLQLLYSSKTANIQSISQTVQHFLLPEISVKDALVGWNFETPELPVADAQGVFFGIVKRENLTHLVSPENVRGEVPAVKAGNALADLYLIGLSSLLGRSD